MCQSIHGSRDGVPVSGEFVNVGVALSMGVRAWENGTLRISLAKRHHEGRYLCEANNGVGGGLSKVIALQVNGK